MKNAKERMDVIAAYRDVGTYRGAAAMCGTTHKTVRRIIEAHQAATEGVVPVAVVRPRNYDQVIELVADRVKSTSGRVSAKRLLPTARAAGYAGSDRNFRRLVATVKKQWRHDQARATPPPHPQHSMTLTARPPSLVSLYLCDMSMPVWRIVSTTASSET